MRSDLNYQQIPNLSSYRGKFLATGKNNFKCIIMRFGWKKAGNVNKKKFNRRRKDAK